MTVVEERTAARGSLARRRLNGTYTVDEWGLDRDLVEAASPLLGLRWQVEAIGAEVLPARRPVLLVANCRIGWSEPFVLGRGIRLATGRVVRVAGVPDVVPVAPVLRRFGGVLERSDEVAGLLRAGEMVGVMLGQSIRRHRAGDVRADLLAPALVTGADVVPVALIGREIGRRWKVVVGPAIEHPVGRGPLGAADLAERARRGVQSLLDDALPSSLWQRLH